MLEIHDEVAAQIQNCEQDFEYIDGVSSIDEGDDDDGRSRLSSLPEDKDGEAKAEEEMEEVKVDTFRVIGVRRKQGECLVSVKIFTPNKVAQWVFFSSLTPGRLSAKIWPFIFRFPSQKGVQRTNGEAEVLQPLQPTDPFVRNDDTPLD